MACSCKVKNKPIYADPQTNKVLKVDSQNIEAKPKSVTVKLNLSDSITQLPVSDKTYEEISQTLDVSSTTKPDQLCFNCVRKHLGLAYKFLQNRDFIHKLAAVGELLCVVMHLKTTHPNLAYKIRDIVLLNMRKQDLISFRSDVNQLILFLQKDPQSDISQYIPLPSFVQEQQLLTVLLVQALLFIQLTYQQVNKTWATAQLSFFSYNTFRTQNSLQFYELYRPLWKLIQSMKFMDQNYFAARDYIKSILISKYPVYQQILVPRRKVQFQQDYEKQKQLMQKIGVQTQNLPPAT